MCKKRIPVPKFKTISLNKAFFFPAVLAIFFILQGCADEREYLNRSDSLLESYPEVARLIAEREMDGLLRLTDHPDRNASQLAWSAAAVTETDSVGMESLFNTVLDRDEDYAWFALSFHKLNEDQLRRIRGRFQAGEVESDAVCEVFFRHGERIDLEYLLSAGGELQKPACAKAVGGMLTRIESPESLNRAVVMLAFESEREEVRRNLLYGYYRAALNRPKPNSSTLYEASRAWEEFGVGRDEFIDMTMVRMIGLQGFEKVMETLGDRELRERPGLSTDLAASLDLFSPEDTDLKQVTRLLLHRNPHVSIQAVEALTARDTVSEDLADFIENRITIPTRDPELFLASLEFLQKHGRGIDSYMEKLEFLTSDRPYLTGRVLGIHKKREREMEFLMRIEPELQKGGVEALNAGQMLSSLWMEEPYSPIPCRMRDLVLNALESGDRSVIDGVSALLSDGEFFEAIDFDRLNGIYESYLENGWMESAALLGGSLEELYPEQFDRRDPGVDKEFRIPDWQRLYEMGTHPFWKLETEKGTVVVRLDPLTAPFTVSSIDSLTRAGSYDGVVFHRVVRNFVAQGGDFDRRDGFGGPDYRLPTEPSLQSFERGMAGIASSGTDTEGSQFFFMHRWSPHLDGHYTRFGEVTRGMDVVDRLQVGDRIIRASIYPE